MVLVPVPPLPEDQSEDELRQTVDEWIAAARAGVLERLRADAGCDIADDILQEEVVDPIAWRDRFQLRRGAVFGLSHGLEQLSLLRPSRLHPRVENLFFVGANTRPGNGVPLVLTSAKLCAAEVGQVLHRRDQAG